MPDNSTLAQRGCAVAELLLSLPELAGPGVLCLYAAHGHEVPLDAAELELRERGWRLAYPRLDGSELALHEVEGRAGLVTGTYGLPEPLLTARRVPVLDVDLFLVPGILFDRQGARLGRGGGHYDRLLARARAAAPRIGVCVSERLVEHVPVEPHDVRVHLVVTDREVARVA